jgi:predicted outer membrane repeat protein
MPRQSPALFILAGLLLTLLLPANQSVQAAIACSEAALSSAVSAGTTPIDLPAACTITLTADLPPVTTTIVINGNGAVIDGVDTYRPFTVDTTGNLTLNNLTVQNGFAVNGGAIYNQGNVTLINSNLVNNAATYGGGIYSIPRAGVGVQFGSTVSGNIASQDGGGIYTGAFGILLLNASTVSGNTAVNGGGIWNDASLSMQNNAVISGNIAMQNGGGIRNGGGITVDGSIIKDNSASYGGGIWNQDSLVVQNASILANNTADNSGGAIYSDASASVTGSCITGNSATSVLAARRGDTVSAMSNWWGSADGPGPIGPGSGDTVSADVDFSNFLTAPPDSVSCDTLPPVTVSVNDASVFEGAASTTTAIMFAVALSVPNPYPTDITVDYSTIAGSATEGTDYVGASGTVHIPAHSSSASILIIVNGDNVAEGDETFSVTLSNASTNVSIADATGIGTIQDGNAAGVSISPIFFTMNEDAAPQAYQITLESIPSSGQVSIELVFDPEQLLIDGKNTSPLTLTFSDTAPQSITINVRKNADSNTSRTTVIQHRIVASDAPEYSVGLELATVTVQIDDLPPPPPSPTCEEENFNPDGVVRTGIPDALRYAINCRILFQNGEPTSWLGTPLYSEANLGLPGLLDLGVEQAVDFFSPPGLTYFQGGAVFCVRGEGTLIWLAASGQPRHAEIIGSYLVPEFSGFTCVTLFEPGTLILVSHDPLQ